MAYDHFRTMSTDDVRRIFEDPKAVRKEYLERLRSRINGDDLYLRAGSEYSLCAPEGMTLELTVEEGSGSIKCIELRDYSVGSIYFISSGEPFELFSKENSKFRLQLINDL